MAIPTVDEVWADYNVDGSVKEPFKQDIRRLLNFMLAAATAGSAAKRYPTKAAMDADTTQADGTTALIYADPVAANNYPTLWYWNDAGNVWVMGVDRLSPLVNGDARHNAESDQLFLTTGVPRPIGFGDATSFAATWVTIANPSTRWTIDASAAGFQVTGIAGLGAGIWPVGIKLLTDFLPGDSWVFEGTYTGGTMTSSTGFFAGTDTAMSGDLSAAARLTVYRNGSLLPSLANGLSGDGGRSLSPVFGPNGGAMVLNQKFQFMLDIQPDRSQAWRIFRDGLQVGNDVVATPTPLGAVVIGALVTNGQTFVITKVTRRMSPGAALYVHSGVGVSGDGTRGSPLKTLNDIPAAIVNLGIAGQPVTINFLTDNVYGYLELKDTLSPRWTLNGTPGGNTSLNGFNFAEVPVWTVVPGTSNLVWTTPNKFGLETRSAPNQVFINGLAWNPRPWYSMPATTVDAMVTANGGLDMVPKIRGANATQGGLVYLRLPDGLPSTNPNDYPLPIDPLHALPTDPHYSLIVARTLSLLTVRGSPEVNLNNLALRWAAGPTFDGGSGFGRITNCRFEWSGSNSPGIEEHNGQFVYEGCHFRYSDGDCVGRTPRVDIPFQAGTALVTRLHQCELSHTGRQEITPGVFLGGDGLSVHVVEDGSNRRNELWMTACWVHDTYKCGVVVSADLWIMDGCVVERAGTEQVSLFAVPTASAAGRTMRAIITNTRIDPGGVGNSGVRAIYTDGMALNEMQLDNCWIGTPAGVGAAELWVSAQALAGGVRDITKNRIVYRNCTTERAPGSVVKTGGGTGGTFVPIASFPLA